MIKTVLNKSTVLSPCDEKTNIICPFTVKGEVNAVYIDFDYSPKNLDDFEKSKFLIKKCLSVDEPDITDDMINFNDFLPLKNLVTVSVYSPCGWVGSAHRHNPVQHHIVNKIKSSPGFISGEIVPGEWYVCINVHAVVTDECICNLKVSVGGDGNE